VHDYMLSSNLAHHFLRYTRGHIHQLASTVLHLFSFIQGDPEKSAKLGRTLHRESRRRRRRRRRGGGGEGGGGEGGEEEGEEEED